MTRRLRVGTLRTIQFLVSFPLAQQFHLRVASEAGAILQLVYDLKLDCDVHEWRESQSKSPLHDAFGRSERDDHD